ncbi:MAG TPA: hypothetical protein VF384_03310 [Planctomycetota bacterium]
MLRLVEVMTWDLIKTPTTARIVPSIVYRNRSASYFVCVVELDAQNGFGAMLRSYLAFIVRSDVPQPANEGYRTPDRVRDECSTANGTLWIQCIEKFDSLPDRRTLCASRQLANLGPLFGDDDRGWSID